MISLILALTILVGGLGCFWVAIAYKDKVWFLPSGIFIVVGIVMIWYGALGRPIQCADGYYRMYPAVYEKNELRFMAHRAEVPMQTYFCSVPFKNVHTLNYWQNVYILLIHEGFSGQHLYLSPPSRESDTE